MIEFQLPYPPSVNHIYRRTGRGGRQVVLKDSVRDWRADAGWAYKAAGGRVLHGRVMVEVSLYPPAKGRVGDVDNALKATLDALKGVAYRDDEQVTMIVVVRMYREGVGKAVVRVSTVAGQEGRSDTKKEPASPMG